MSCDSCEIKNLIYRYAHYIDSGDLDAVAGMFAEGCIVAGESADKAARISGSAAIAELYSSFTRLYEDDGTPHTMHLTSNVVIDLAPDGESASASCYAVVFQAVEELPLQPIIGVRYYDEFRKSDGRWRFAERRIVPRLTGDLSHHLLQQMQDSP